MEIKTDKLKRQWNKIQRWFKKKFTKNKKKTGIKKGEKTAKDSIKKYYQMTLDAVKQYFQKITQEEILSLSGATLGLVLLITGIILL